jgi:cytoskeleton protein RodZ
MSEADSASDQPPLPGSGDTPGGPGALLLEARRAQGMSIGDVARQLKLSVRQVEALERDDYSAFPGPVFVRGFLRNYAKLLRLDEDGLIALARLPSSAAPPATVESELGAEPPQRSMRAGVLLGAVVLAVLIGLAFVLRGGRSGAPDRIAAPMTTPGMPSVAGSPQRADSPPPSAAPLGVPTALSGTAASATAVPLPAPGVTAVPDTTQGAATAAPPSPPPPVEQAAPRAGAAPEVERREVRLTFQNQSWVEIRNGAGEVIFSRLNEAGSERVVRGAPPLTVVIGNARGVTLSYRGKPVDLAPHTKVDVARLTLE